MTRQEEVNRATVKELLEGFSDAEISTLCISALRTWRRKHPTEGQFSVHGALGLEVVPLLLARKGRAPIDNDTLSGLKEPFITEQTQLWFIGISDFLGWFNRKGFGDVISFERHNIITIRLTRLGMRFLDDTESNPLPEGVSLGQDKLGSRINPPLEARNAQPVLHETTQGMRNRVADVLAKLVKARDKHTDSWDAEWWRKLEVAWDQEYKPTLESSLEYTPSAYRNQFRSNIIEFESRVQRQIRPFYERNEWPKASRTGVHKGLEELTDFIATVIDQLSTPSSESEGSLTRPSPIPPTGQPPAITSLRADTSPTTGTSAYSAAPLPSGNVGASAHPNPDVYDVAIICALADPEMRMVLDTGDGPWRSLPAHPNDPSSYYKTMYTTAKGKNLRVVAAAPTQMGMPASAVLATKMILSFRPRLIAMVGIAAGVGNDKQNYGDILVPNQTFDYGAGKLTQRMDKIVFEPAPDPIRISERLRGRLDHWRVSRIGLDEISQQWKAKKPPTRLEIHVGPLGSGAAVIDTKQSVLDVLDHWRKLIGIEMEAYGVHLASQNATSPAPEFLCMKSICDFANNKTDDWQPYAAFTAAKFCHRFLIDEWETLFPGT